MTPRWTTVRTASTGRFDTSSVLNNDDFAFLPHDHPTVVGFRDLIGTHGAVPHRLEHPISAHPTTQNPQPAENLSPKQEI